MVERLKISEYYELSIDEIFKKLKSSESGINHQEAVKRIAKYGNNHFKLPRDKILKKISDNLLLNLNLLNLILGLILSVIGKNKLFIIVFLIFIILEIILNLFRTLKNNSLYKTMLPRKITIIRPEQKIYTSSTNLVPGDVIEIHKNEIVPADVRIINNHLNINEHNLFYNYENPNFLFMGEVNYGQTIKTIVVETGYKTELGQLLLKNNLINYRDFIFNKIIKKYYLIKIVLLISITILIFLINLNLQIPINQIVNILLILTMGSVFLTELDNINNKKLKLNLKNSFQIAYTNLINIDQDTLFNHKDNFEKINKFLNQGIKLIISSEDNQQKLLKYLTQNKIPHKLIPKNNFENLKDQEIIKLISTNNVILITGFNHNNNLRLSEILKHYNINNLYITKHLSDLAAIKNSSAGIIINHELHLKHQRNLDNLIISKLQFPFETIIKNARLKIINLENIIIFNLMLFFSITFITLLGFINYYFYNIPYIINPVQVLIILIPIQYLLIHNFNQSNNNKTILHKNNFFNQIFSIENLKKIILTPLLFSLMSYLIFILIFKFSQISPYHIDLSNPIYLQATTSVFIFFNLTLYINMYFNIKNNKSNYFFNRRLVLIILINLLILLLSLYTNILRHYIWSLNLIQLSTIVVISLIYFVLKLLGQHIKKHNRKSILTLHEEIIHLINQ